MHNLLYIMVLTLLPYMPIMLSVSMKPEDEI
jgi:hypothetical protein